MQLSALLPAFVELYHCVSDTLKLHILYCPSHFPCVTQLSDAASTTLWPENVMVYLATVATCGSCSSRTESPRRR